MSPRTHTSPSIPLLCAMLAVLLGSAWGSGALPGMDRDAWIFPATPSAGPRLGQSRGDQKVLVISIETADFQVAPGTWPPTATRARQIAEDLNRDFMTASYGRLGLTFIYVPEVIRIPGVKADYRSFASETLPATTIAKTLDPRYDLAQVNRVWLVNNFNRCGTGCAYISGKQFGNGLARDGVARHEINHTNGLDHIGAFVPVNGNPFDTATFQEHLGDDIGAVHMRSGSRYHLRWLVDNDPDGFGPRALASTAAATGLHTLVDVASTEPVPGLFRGLRFPRVVPNGSLWPASTFNSYILGFSDLDDGVHLQAVANLAPSGFDTRTQNGGFQLGHDISGPDASRNARLALRVGRSTRIPEGVVISPVLSQPAAGGRPAVCYTEVRAGPFPGNRAPTLNLTMEPAQPVVGSVVRIRATAGDADGDPLSYHWVVGGTSRITPAADTTWVETTAMRPGTTVYRVEVHDRRGGIISRSVTMAVPAITTASGAFYVDGTVADSNTGRPLAGAEVVFAGRTMTTGADGRYVFPNVPEGTYNGNDRPRITLAHYPTRYLTNSGASFIVATGRRMTNETVRLARTVADPVGIVLATPELTVDEGGTAQVRVERTGNTGVAIQVRYLLMADRADAGRDFTGGNGVLTIPAGSADAVIAIPILSDATPDPGERILVALTGIEAAYPIITPVAGPAPVATITIRDADGGGSGGNAAPVIERIQADADRKVLP